MKMTDDHLKMKETWAKAAANVANQSRDYFIDSLREMMEEKRKAAAKCTGR